VVAPIDGIGGWYWMAAAMEKERRGRAEPAPLTVRSKVTENYEGKSG
jgi:hypothetical protein